MDDRLYRSTTDRSIAGVAGGMAAWLGIDPSLVRVGWVLAAILSGGLFVIVYIVMMIVVPLAPPGWVPRRSAGPGAPGAPGGWGTPSGAWGAPSGAWGTAPGTPDATQGPQGPTTGPQGQGPQGAAGPAWPSGWNQRPPDADRSRNAEGAGIAVGVFLVLLGGWLLVRQYFAIDWALVWPVVIIGLGAALIVGAATRSR